MYIVNNYRMVKSSGNGMRKHLFNELSKHCIISEIYDDADDQRTTRLFDANFIYRNLYCDIY